MIKYCGNSYYEDKLINDQSNKPQGTDSIVKVKPSNSLSIPKLVVIASSQQHFFKCATLFALNCIKVVKNDGKKFV